MNKLLFLVAIAFLLGSCNGESPTVTIRKPIQSISNTPSVGTIEKTPSQHVQRPTKENPVVLGKGFLRTKLYEESGSLIAFEINGEPESIANWNDDFFQQGDDGYFVMGGVVYFLNKTTGISPDTSMKFFPCLSGLLQGESLYFYGNLYGTGFQENELTCIDSPISFLNILNKGIIISEIPSSQKVRYLPSIDGTSLTGSIYQSEDGTETYKFQDKLNNHLNMNCGHGGCEVVAQ